MNSVIVVENLSKSYRLGQVGTGTLTNDLKVWWAKRLGMPNPLLKIGQEEHGNRDGEEVWALKDVSFQVEQGEVLGIIGRNGAGKSTLLKILSRVTAPTSGEVKVKGRIASLLEVGTGFHPELTGRENIYLNGAILGMSKQEVSRKFDEIVDFAEVDKFIDTPVKRYSSGMYVRLAFAVAAHLEPEILLVDEVLAVGDVEFQKKCLGKMGDVAKEGRTVLFVSHNMAAIQQLCTFTITMSNGSICYSGDTKEAVDKYLSRAPLPARFRSNKEEPLAINSTKKFKLENISFSNDQHSKEIVASGSDLFINLQLYSEEVIRKLVVTLGINDNNGTRLSVLHSKLAGYELSQVDKNLKVTCQIKELKLLPGKYSIDVKIYNDLEMLIWAENAIELIVDSGNVLKSGKIPPKKWGGYFILDQVWTQSTK